MGGTTDPVSGIAAYRQVLRLPGVGALTAVALLARLPTAAAPITLTLHVVLTLEHGYAAAGLVGAASTVGMAVAAPLLGRLVDRRGLRTMLALTLSAGAVFWSVAPLLPYPALLAAALFGGLLSTPVYSVTRQSLAALIPAAQRRPAFAIDSMAVELSYIIGPAVGTVLALQASTRVGMWTVGAGYLLSTLALLLLNPPTRAPQPADAPPATATVSWFGLPLLGALLATMAGVIVIFGTELTMIAGLQLGGQAHWIPLVNAVWAGSSLVGGFLYGAARRALPLPLLVGALGVVTLPVAFAGPWWSYMLLLVPVGLLVAPSMAAGSEAVSALAPEHARGVVTGLHGSAITLGAAVATPLAGLLIDTASPATAVLVVGGIGIGAAVAVALLGRWGARRTGRLASSAGSQPI